MQKSSKYIKEEIGMRNGKSTNLSNLIYLQYIPFFVYSLTLSEVGNTSNSIDCVSHYTIMSRP